MSQMSKEERKSAMIAGLKEGLIWGAWGALGIAIGCVIASKR